MNHIKSGQSERCPTDIDSLKIVPALGPQQEFHFYHLERKLWRCDEWRYDVKTKSLKNHLFFIAFSDIRPISFSSENRVLNANLIDKTVHFRRVQKRKNAFKTDDLLPIPLSQTYMRARLSTCDLMQLKQEAGLRKCYKNNGFLTILWLQHRIQRA